MMAGLAGTTVLVSGASGYVGAHVVKTLLDRGYSVRGTVRSTSNKTKIGHLQGLIDAGERLTLVEADLVQPESWPAAVDGCTYVCHVASPFVFGISDKDADTLIKPAVDGTLNVLRPCMVNEGVKKVVLVSSVASIHAGWDTPCQGVIMEPEKRWSVPEKCEPYVKSKTLAEMAAWDLVKDEKNEGSVELAVVNPSLVIGPSLTKNTGTSIDICTQILNRKMMATPHLCLNVVDVRDVAEGIVRSMEKPEASGERVVLSGAAIWLNDLSQAAIPVFEPLGYRPPHKNMPSPLLRFLSWFVPSLRGIAGSLGNFFQLDNSKAKSLLGMEFIGHEDSFVSMCHSVIQHGIVEKTPKYAEWEKESADVGK